jgi:cytochrome c-type biogenesis protein
MEDVSLVVCFVAGVLSFLSPCVLPLIPAYVSFITGLSVKEMSSPETVGVKQKWGVLIQSLLFVSGFSLVFILMGASATVLGGFVGTYQGLLRIIGGVIVGVFGLHMMGIINIRFLQYERRVYMDRLPTHFLGPVFVGAAFGLGWTPCIGPILGSILTYASVQDTVAKGILLLVCYSTGMAIPFILSGLAINTFLGVFSRISRYFGVISTVSGAILIILGILIATGNLRLLAVGV